MGAEVFLTVGGALLVATGLHDMFHSLMNPSGRGHVSRWIMHGIWCASKPLGRRFRAVVGPAALVTVVIAWVAFQVLGFALIYLPHVPTGLTYAPGIDPANYSDPAEALYISLVTLSTLGFGDVVATQAWVRMTVPFEGLIGFALLTSALTWFSRVYSPLERRRALALEIRSLVGVGFADRCPELDPREVSRVLDGLSTQLDMIRVDFTQHTETYYFREVDEDLSLPRWLSAVVPMAAVAGSSSYPGVTMSGQRLTASLDRLAEVLKSGFARSGGDTAGILAAYASDHGHTGRP
ncbi:potassium channel family protein [Brevibacterium sp.]|uniref:potassium channel family protein n=1 Tax=Brevibacterium sp. TaxID=1701 RepID=UPI00281238BB|nr:potassium channel family protein [Brevibacterium sp.]